MGENTTISWADHTFNPWMGCQKVSPACQHCYAERDMDHRYGKVKWGPQGTRVLTSDSNWRKPLKWNKQADEYYQNWLFAIRTCVSEYDYVEPYHRPRVFCSSLADVFEDWDGPISQKGSETSLTMNAVRERLFKLIDATPNIDWLLLTKRPENIRRMWIGPERSNVWLGTSVENQEYARKRIVHLLECRSLSPVLWLSCEPLLGPLDLTKVTCLLDDCNTYNALDVTDDGAMSVDDPDAAAIDWVIAGGESGPNARPSHPRWFRSLRDQCGNANVPFHFKQWGEYIPETHVDDQEFVRRIERYKSGACKEDYCRFFDGDDLVTAGMGCSSDEVTTMFRVGTREAGRMLDGVEHDDYPVGIEV